jgi:hypothetical protein
MDRLKLDNFFFFKVSTFLLYDLRFFFKKFNLAFKKLFKNHFHSFNSFNSDNSDFCSHVAEFFIKWINSVDKKFYSL